jgi:transposase-like protein
MSTLKRRQHKPEFKAKVVLELLTGQSSVAALARKHQRKETQLYEWRAHALEHLPWLFSRSEVQSVEQQRIAELERLIGQLTIDNEALKKASHWLSRLSRANDTL